MFPFHCVPSRRPPVPKKPAAPPELRPFSYLNPTFRPNDPTDVEGMRAHSALPEDLAMRPQSMKKNYYFPADGYDKPRGVKGFPRRHDSLRAYRTQAPPTTLKRFSSTRVQPGYYGRPLEPIPDYDFTMKRRPSSSGQSKSMHDSVVLSDSSGGGMFLSLPSLNGDADLRFASTSTKMPHPSVHIPTSTPPTDAHTRSRTGALRRASLPDILPPQPPHHPSPLFYTKTMNRTHLQVYSSRADDSLTLPGEQTDTLIFGGVFVPSYSRRLTSYISNSILKGVGNEEDEALARFWEAQWRSMREGRARLRSMLTSDTRQASFSSALSKSEGNEIREANEGIEHITETMGNGKDLPHIPFKTSPTLLNSGDAKYPFTSGTNTFTNSKTIENFYHDTVDSIRTSRNETQQKNEPTPLNRHTTAGHKSANKKRKHRKLSEIYVKVSLQGEPSSRAFSLSPRPLSLSSEDLLPNDPAFPILHGVNHLRAH